ncbi:MAG: hypothetical protein ACI9F9_001260 [Candidatus Paceibacteria bacterium]|jgi:hypothetical protein
MVTSEIRLWPGVPDLRALGARSFEDLMGSTGELEGEPQGEPRPAPGEVEVLRYALPGTIHHPGTKPTAPRGAGTGFVDVWRWRGGPWGQRLSARFRSPRSESFAAHAWNLYCHLREAGVGTAEPMAMGQQNSMLFASESFLVTRAMEPMQSLREYLETNEDDRGRRQLCHALGLFLRRILQARVELPALTPATLFVSRRKLDASCAIRKIADQAAGRQPQVPTAISDLDTRPLPELALVDVHGGRIHEQFPVEAQRAQLQVWAANREVQELFRPRERLRVAHYALGTALAPRPRRRALRQLTSMTPNR